MRFTLFKGSVSPRSALHLASRRIQTRHGHAGRRSTRVSGCTCALVAAIAWTLFCTPSKAQQLIASGAQGGTISGTVTDNDGDVITGATVLLQTSPDDAPYTVSSNDSGAFTFSGLPGGTTYQIIVQANGCLPWTSAPLALEPGQFLYLPAVKLTFSGGTISVTVTASSVSLATEQVHLEEKQRVLGFIPNFYVAYDPQSAPLTRKLKLELGLRYAVDPVTFLGAAVVAGADQAADTPNFSQGAKGYGQRLGVNYANSFVDVMAGSVVLPSILHQDPRYFYKGTGSAHSRLLYAMSRAFICKGDNGRWQPNYSAIGGDLVAGAVSNAYYPASNRGAGLFAQNSLVSMGARVADNLLQEFVLRRFTTHAHGN